MPAKKGVHSLQPQNEKVGDPWICYVCGRDNVPVHHVKNKKQEVTDKTTRTSFKCRGCSTPWSYIATLPELNHKRLHNAKSSGALVSVAALLAEGAATWTCPLPICRRMNPIGSPRCFMCELKRPDSFATESGHRNWMISDSKNFGQMVQKNRQQYWDTKCDRINQRLQRELKERQTAELATRTKQKALADKHRRARELQARQLRQIEEREDRELREKLRAEAEAKHAHDRKIKFMLAKKKHDQEVVRNQAHNQGVYAHKTASKKISWKHRGNKKTPSNHQPGVMNDAEAVHVPTVMIPVSDQSVSTILMNQSFSNTHLCL